MVILHRIDKLGGGLLLYVREDIPSKIVKAHNSNESKTIYPGISLRNKTWLLGCS